MLSGFCASPCLLLNLDCRLEHHFHFRGSAAIVGAKDTHISVFNVVPLKHFFLWKQCFQHTWFGFVTGNRTLRKT